jgi:hypothetical protein
MDTVWCMWFERSAVGVALLATLLACRAGGSQFVSYEPHSVRMNGKQIAKRAVLVGPGDLGPIKAAGGLPAGTLTMRSDGSLDSVAEAAAETAAEVGGTHYMIGTWGEETSTTGYYAPNNWTVIPITHTEKTVRFAVIRVPYSGWENLPARFTPQPF